MIHALLFVFGFFKHFSPAGGVNTFTISPSQLILVELFAIGIPSFILAVQVNDNPVKGAKICATPADWTPGDDVIKCNPDTLKEAETAGHQNTDTTKAWFLTLEKLPIDKIQKKVKIKSSDKK